MKILSGITILSVLLLSACSSAEPKDEVVANGSAGNTGHISDVPAPKVPEEKKDPQPDNVTTFEGGKIENTVVIDIMDRMDKQGCLFDKVALTTHKQWGQFILKCNAPSTVPAVD